MRARLTFTVLWMLATYGVMASLLQWLGPHSYWVMPGTLAWLAVGVVALIWWPVKEN